MLILQDRLFRRRLAWVLTEFPVISANLLLDHDTDPVIWRGPVIAGAVKQFWQEALWENVDYMFVDMPPGTGDVPLTVFQSLPVDGILIVTSPQELVSMIVAKAVNMAKKMNIPILGLVENMSYLECPDCGKKISVFGESHIDEIAKEHELPVLAKLPIDPVIVKHVDEGLVEYLEESWMDEAAKKGNIFLCSHIQEKPDHGSAQALAAKGRKYLYLVKTDAVVPGPGSKKGSHRTVRGRAFRNTGMKTPA